MAAIAPALFAGLIATTASTVIQNALRPDPADLDVPEVVPLASDAAGAFREDARSEARRRRAAAPPLINPVGAPRVRTGSPTIILGG